MNQQWKIQTISINHWPRVLTTSGRGVVGGHAHVENQKKPTSHVGFFIGNFPFFHVKTWSKMVFLGKKHFLYTPILKIMVEGAHYYSKTLKFLQFYIFWRRNLINPVDIYVFLKKPTFLVGKNPTFFPKKWKKPTKKSPHRRVFAKPEIPPPHLPTRG